MDEPELLDLLIDMRRSRVATHGRPEDHAELGASLLERWDEHQRPEDVDEALIALQAATASDQDRAQWWWWLARAYMVRAELTRAPTDLDEAIAAGRRALRSPDASPADEAGILGELLCLRYDRHVAEQPDPQARAGLGELLTELEALDRLAQHKDVDIQIALGLVQAERLRRFEETDALAACVDLLEPVLERPDIDGPLRTAAAAALVHAYLTRHEANPDADDLHRAIALARREARRADPRDLNRAVLRDLQYYGHSQLLTDDATRRDLDAAISCLRDLLAVTTSNDLPVETDIAYDLACLLADRGERFDRTDDLAEAVTWFSVVVNQEPDISEVWLPRLRLALAADVRYSLTADPQDLHSVADSTAAALAAGIPDTDPRLAAWLLRLNAERLLARVADDGSPDAPRTDGVPDRPPDDGAFGRDVTRWRDIALAAADEVERHPEGDRAIRSGLAAFCVDLLLQVAAHEAKVPDVPRLERLLAIADGLEGSDLPWRQLITFLRSKVALLHDYAAESPGKDFGLAEIAQALAMPTLDPAARLEMRAVLALGRYGRAARTGDLRELDAVLADLAHARAEASHGGDQVPALDGVYAMASMARVGARGNRRLADLQRHLAVVVPTLTEAQSPYERALGSFMRNLERLAAVAAGVTPPPAAAVQSYDPGPGPVDPSVAGIAVYDAAVACMLTTTADPAGVEAAVGRLQAAVQRMPPEAFMRSEALIMAAGAILVVSQSDPRWADSGIAWGEEGLRRGLLITAPVMLAPVRMVLAHLHRVRAGRDRDPRDRAEARRHGLAALAGHAWSVLVQRDAAYALDAAVGAADDARTVATWCRADAAEHAGDERTAILADLVRALDAGRGLVLHAATATERVRDLLAERGEAELARAFGALVPAPPTPAAATPAPESPAIPADLEVSSVDRLQAIRLLANPDDPGAIGLVVPPSPAEIGEALRSGGYHALVYLACGSGRQPGFATLVTADGEVVDLPLPGLTEESSQLSWYKQTYVDAHLTLAGDIDVWRWALRDLCQWAGRVGMRDVLGEVRRLAGGALPRLVLVPLGELGIVPWHAASWLTDDGRRRYAVQDAMITFAASARLWCATVARPPVPHGDVLIVANPTGNLPTAEQEAQALRQHIYVEATYLGRPDDQADGRGTAGEVLDWLDDPRPRQLLHIASHAVVDPHRPVESRIELADSVLRAGDVLNLAGRRLDTVVLAACTTNVAAGVYDEALSLASAFQTAGARSVIGSLWSVPSRSTAILMFLFHQFLRAGPMDAASALRRAQLWMLDPDREHPDNLPTDLVTGENAEELDDPYRWAGFTHLGC